MRTTLALMILALMTLAIASPAASATEWRPEAVYGEDHRRDLFEVADPAWVERARSVGAFFDHKDVRETSAGDFELRLAADGREDRLCEDQRFFRQPRGAFCTGFLVGPRTVLTAGHCIEKQKQCAKAAFVFGFAYGRDGEPVAARARDQVYRCHRLIAGGKDEDDDLDYALIELDRQVVDRSPLAAEIAGDYRPGTPLAMIGHAEGLPAKFVDQAVIRQAKGRRTFEADLSSFTGNSGSPVFDAGTGRVLGVLVAGETDYVKRGKCYAVKKCTATGCAGEDVLRIDRVPIQAR